MSAMLRRPAMSALFRRPACGGLSKCHPGRKRAFDAIDPDEVFDRRALLEEDRQCDILHRQAKRDAKRQQQRLKKGPLKSIPEQGDADGEEAGGDLVTSRGGQPVAASPTRRPACVAASLWRPACSRQL